MTGDAAMAVRLALVFPAMLELLPFGVVTRTLRPAPSLALSTRVPSLPGQLLNKPSGTGRCLCAFCWTRTPPTRGQGSAPGADGGDPGTRRPSHAPPPLLPPSRMSRRPNPISVTVTTMMRGQAGTSRRATPEAEHKTRERATLSPSLLLIRNRGQKTTGGVLGCR